MNTIPTTPRVDALLSSFLEDSRKPGETALTVMAKRGLELTDLANTLERELVHYKRLESILEDRSDVRDGPDGEQRPNEAMSILTEWRGPV